MMLDFALSLSVDGIVLLHRVPDGWHRVGDVDLSSDDLGGDMSALCDKAKSLIDGDVRTKLILPHDQIRFMAIETARTSLEDIEDAIREATPLALDEMVIDFDRSGGRTHIAAVAKQTLLEAETFALEHGFTPVAFVANAEPYTFSSEVFFGPTNHARDVLGLGAAVTRDAAPAIETGVMPELAKTQDLPDELPPENVPMFASRHRADQTEPAFVRAAGPVIDTPIANFNRRSQDIDPERKLTLSEVLEKISDAPPIVAAPTPNPAPPNPQTVASPPRRLLPFRRPDNTTTPATLSTTDAALARGVASADTLQRPRYLGLGLTAALIAVMTAVGFWANRQVDGGVAGLLEVDPGLQEETEVAEAAPIVVTPEPEEPAQPLVADVAPVPEAAEEQSPPAPIVTAIPGRVLSPADAARIYAATGVWQRAPRLPGEPQEADQSTLYDIHEFAVVTGVEGISQPSGPASVVTAHDIPIIAPRNPAPANRPLPRDEDGFVLATANGTILPTGVPIFGRAPARTPPLRPTDEPVGLDDSSLPIIPDDVVTEIQFVAYIPESDLPPVQSFRSPALTQPIPVLRPEREAPEGLAGAKFITALPPAAPREPGPAVTDTIAAEPTAPIAEQTVTALTAVEQSPQNRQVPAQTIAANADNPPIAVEPAQQSGDLFDASADFVEVILGRPTVVPPLRPGTPEIAPQTDVADTQVTAPVPSEAETTDVAEGLSRDASDAQLVFQDPELAGFRPNPRPATLLPASAATFEAIPALAGPRPELRPAGLAPETEAAVADAVANALEEDPAVANTNDISAIVASIAAAAPPSQIINPTRSAIVASPRPDLRPQNFNRVVAAAQSLQQRQQTRAVAASTSSAVAQAPAPATAPATGGQTAVTVARAATIDNAIRLRDMNLIGVYGKPGARRALVRMPNGRFVKVEVGSSLDGGRVTAIGDSALNFVKRGQTYALQLPAG